MAVQRDCAAPGSANTTPEEVTLIAPATAISVAAAMTIEARCFIEEVRGEEVYVSGLNSRTLFRRQTRQLRKRMQDRRRSGAPNLREPCGMIADTKC